MSDWAAKRFWTDVHVEPENNGFGIRLDGRSVKTPAKAPLVVPTSALAQEIAAEWAKVDVKIDPNVMPFTRSANAAIDKVAAQFDEVAEMLAGYGATDLLCYRADSPAGLVERQDAGWGPLLAWAADTYGAQLKTTIGLMPIEQDEAALRAISAPLFKATTFELTAIHDLVALSGSLLLALSVTAGKISPLEAWSLSRIDEKWQAEQWGEDEDAVRTEGIKRVAFIHAANFYQLVQNTPDG